jgi:hypothetical protein
LTDLVFAGDIDVSLERRSAVATFERRLTPAWTLQLGAGGLLWGNLGVGGVRHHLGPGVTASIAASYRLRDGRDGYPFVLLGGSLAFAYARTYDERAGGPDVRYTAADLRVSAVAGKTLFDAVSPYVVARAFGGPIFWSLRGADVSGTDRYHFQLGVGLSASAPAGLDVFVELIPLGERAVTCGAGFSF